MISSGDYCYIRKCFSFNEYHKSLDNIFYSLSGKVPDLLYILNKSYSQLCRTGNIIMAIINRPFSRMIPSNYSWVRAFEYFILCNILYFKYSLSALALCSYYGYLDNYEIYLACSLTGSGILHSGNTGSTELKRPDNAAKTGIILCKQQCF